MKLCIQTGDIVDELGFEEGYRMIKDAGFTTIDWNLDHAWKMNTIIKANDLKELCIFEKSLPEIMDHYAEELAFIKNNGLTVSQAHAPFPAYVEGRPDILEYAIKVYCGNILFCNKIGCKKLVIHGISLFATEQNKTPEDYKKMNMHLYESLIPTLQQTDIIVCLENLFTKNGSDFLEGTCSNPFEAVEYIDTLNKKAGKMCFGLCLDTGHLNLLHKSFRVYMPILGDRIKALHIHDNDASSDQHLAPYTGTIIWKDFINGLKQIGYNGDLSFETFRQVTIKRVDKPVIMPFLKLIAQIGEYFKSELTN